MKPPIYAIGYARVSSPKQAQEGESLDDQARAISRFAEHNEWTLFPDGAVIEEQFTGKVNHRPLYTQALKLIKKNPGKVKYFVVKVIDRFSRAGSMDYQLMKAELARLGVELRDLSGVIQPKVNTLDHLGFNYEWSMSSPSQISEVVLAEQARSERSGILTRLISAEIALTQNGFQIGAPNDGFINSFVEINGRKKCVQTPDPDRAHYFVKMYNLRAEGVYSDEEIVKRINAMGYRSKPHKRWSRDKKQVMGYTVAQPLTVKQFQRILARPAYAGVICEKWTHNLPVKAQWNGLVSINTFNRANRGKVFIEELDDNTVNILYNVNRKPRQNKRQNFRLDFEYKNIVLCSICNKPMLASLPKGKSGKTFPTYHCARNHRYVGVSKADMDTAWASCFYAMRFSDAFLEKLEEVLIASYRLQEGVAAQQTGKVKLEVAQLQEKKAMLLQSFNFATTQIMRQSIEDEMVKLQAQIDDVRELREKLELGEEDIHSFIANAKNLMEHPENMLAGIDNKAEQVSIFNLFFDKYPTYPELLNRTPKHSFLLRLKQQYHSAQSLFVNVQSLEWNSIEKMIIEWNTVCAAIKRKRAMKKTLNLE